MLAPGDRRSSARDCTEMSQRLRVQLASEAKCQISISPAVLFPFLFSPIGRLFCLLSSRERPYARPYATVNTYAPHCTFGRSQ